MLLSRPEFKDQIHGAEPKRRMNKQAWLSWRTLSDYTNYEAYDGGLTGPNVIWQVTVYGISRHAFMVVQIY